MPTETKQKPIKKFYTVNINAMIPVDLQYKIFAETPELAIEEAKKLSTQHLLHPPKFHWHMIKRIKAAVYDFGMLIKKLEKNL